MKGTQIIRIVFGSIAAVMLMAAVANVVLDGRLTIFPSWAFGLLIVVALAFILNNFFLAREHANLLSAQAVQLKTVASRLESSLGNAAAMNARLNQSEVRYKGLVDAQGDAIFRRDASSRLTYANDAFFRLFGVTPQRAIGYPFAPELHPDSRANMFGSFASLEAGRGRARYDQHVRTAYGFRWIAWEDYAVRDQYGRLVEVQSVGRDITERKALEDALTDARDRAEAGSRAKSGFLATMSHEIRTPMNGVLGMARLLMETGLSPEQRTYADAIAQSGAALLSLIGDILDFSKIESGTLTLDEDEVELRGLVEGVVELLGPRAHAKDIELVSLTAMDVPRKIRTDEVRLRQVLTNLVGNAIKFTEKGGIHIEAKLFEGRDRHFLRFEVRDTGVGVPEKKRKEIFQEFVQADSSHARKFGGTGLGLAISKRLIETMGGEIGVDAAQGGGSLFWFTLPAVVVETAQQFERLPLTDMCVAVVTKNLVLRDSLTAQIKAMGGEIFGAPDSYGRPRKPDAMLIDAGTDVSPKPPAQPEVGIPALVLVTPAARSKLAQLKAMGFAGYLVKPVRQASLSERIQSARSFVPVEIVVPVVSEPDYETQRYGADEDVAYVPRPESREEIAEAPDDVMAAEEAAPADAPIQPRLLEDGEYARPEAQIEALMAEIAAPRRATPRSFLAAGPAPEPVLYVEPEAVVVHAPPPVVAQPVSAPPLAAAPPVQTPPLPPMVPKPRGAKGLKILLAEDNPINLLLTRELLRRRGHTTTDVTSGDKAVALLETQTFDILLTDIHMPGMDGIEAAIAIRENEASSGRTRIPIVALTADALETGKRACKDAGMDGFLTKPVDPAELEEMLASIFPSDEKSPRSAAA